ncbi:hypothetical protein COF42_30380, partial [Bacillus wiedmannii]|uniref:hypothetical protein n=1 Tax=Bacillus wiedmannii TaxID=1890302 RepID=UPI000C024FCD
MFNKHLDEQGMYFAVNTYRNDVGDPFPAPVLEVNGDTVIDGWYVKAEKIIFKSGSSLWFSEKAQESRTNFYVVAKEIICEDANAPGLISWQRTDVGEQAGTAGQAPTGSHGGGDGESGGSGQSG